MYVCGIKYHISQSSKSADDSQVSLNKTGFSYNSTKDPESSLREIDDGCGRADNDRLFRDTTNVNFLLFLEYLYSICAWWSAFL